MRVGKIGVVVIGLVPFNVYGECTPTPDCASIGYTETSCEGDYLACPFDSTKLKCMPCDSSFRYDCSGENIIGGSGPACGGKYVSCECDGGLPFNKGVCPQSCKVGMIYYSDKSCSKELDNSKTPIGVVAKDNELIVRQIRSTGMEWGTYGTDIDTLPNISTTDDAKADFNGKENTALLVAFQTAEGKTASNSAAVDCNSYSTEGTNTGDWYLPALGELYSYVYGGATNFNKIYVTMRALGWTFNDRYCWSSSEYNSENAWAIDFMSAGSTQVKPKTNTYSVSCFLAIN